MKTMFDAVGIDIGARNARCVYAGKSGKTRKEEKKGKNSYPVIIPNRWGEISTPSFTGWDGDWVVGEDAVRLFLLGSNSVWESAKRKIETDFTAVCGGARLQAQNIITPLFNALREDAEAFLGRFVSSCVLAVPAYFSPTQRELLTAAAEAAGITSVRMISEPVAAALAFGRDGRFLILDCGASQSSISVVESYDGICRLLETSESANIGGDLDLAMAGWLGERLRLGHMPENDPRQRALLLEAEAIKIALSSCHTYDWKPPALSNIPVLQVEREELERTVRFSIKRITNMAGRLWEKHRPEYLLLVGGACRIPLLRDLLEQEIAPEFFNFCAEESIATGAALHAFAGQERHLGEPGKLSVTGRRARDLKMRLVLIEPSLSQAQRERLHLMVSKLENLENDASSIEILEGIVKGLEAEFSQKKPAS